MKMLITKPFIYSKLAQKINGTETSNDLNDITNRK